MLKIYKIYFEKIAQTNLGYYFLVKLSLTLVSSGTNNHSRNICDVLYKLLKHRISCFNLEYKK